MIHITSWPVGARELLARPVPRTGAQPLRRLAAPAHGAWFWPALWALTAAASFVALIPVLFPDGPAVPAHEVMHRISGVSFVVCGLITWRRRPDSDVGRLLTIAGFGVLLSPVLSQIHTPLTLTLATLLDELWILAYAWLILSFVTGGRLVSTVDVVLVAAYFVGLFVFQFAVMLFLDVPENLLLVWPDAGIADALQKVQEALLGGAALAVAIVVGGRWRAASAPRRRALLPSIGGAFSAVLYAAVNFLLILGTLVVPLVTVLNAALITVPAALAWGLLRSRLARGDLADLFGELGTLRGVRLEAGLAKVLGDPRLVLAYRVPGERAYIDGRGQPVELPGAGAERATAWLERDGRELGALVYDASLDDDPELVGAVAAATAITLDDARLQAESQDRLAELRASRERLVAAGDAERRRLERNLHDGAQQRLVSVALQLRMLRNRAAGDPEMAHALELAADELSQSLEELRELARGLHPAVLNHGLKAALESLAARASLPTNVVFESRERLPQPVELAGYFVACEALANAAKHAHATQAAVRVSRRDGRAVVEIADDGIGGVDETAGTGLRGLADRVATLDGTLRVLSPPGKGTVVTAELPCGS